MSIRKGKIKMRKTIAGLTAIILAIGACGCAASATEPITLIGEWQEVDADGETRMGATITEDEIVIKFTGDESAALYWQGTYDGGAASWTSTNTLGEQFALFASSAETKEFTYTDGTIQFPVTMMGVEVTITLEKVN